MLLVNSPGYILFRIHQLIDRISKRIIGASSINFIIYDSYKENNN